ncbi:hypothetical protein AVEN_43225-1 [Araneus ventricosus]|uniref:Uncharacterized protein n=1 Tax=Araneus ventricosus TaxID=182803 RepID=A0A4Y2K9V6_ARAVE|nr:hypothetical protein AVEN_43225-1 [Araneus ventricosus]
MRACLKEDIGASPAEMVYGQCLRCQGEFFLEIPPLPDKCCQRTPYCRSYDSTQEGFVLYLPLTIHRVPFLCTLIFVPHHKFLCVVIQLENHWSNRISMKSFLK